MKKNEALHILGLEQGASDDAIKRAHREKVRENHPDKFVQNSKKHQEAEEKTKLINEARDVLLNHSWEPDIPIDTNYYPYAPQSGQSPFSYQNPGHKVTYVWTSTGGPRVKYSGSPEDIPNLDDFFDPFSSFFTNMNYEETAEQKLARAQSKLIRDARFIGFKLALLALIAFIGNLPAGLLLYALLSLGSFTRREQGCSLILLIPAFALMGPWLIALLPQDNKQLSFFGLFVWIVALVYDGKILLKSFKTWRKCKENVSA